MHLFMFMNLCVYIHTYIHTLHRLLLYTCVFYIVATDGRFALLIGLERVLKAVVLSVMSSCVLCCFGFCCAALPYMRAQRVMLDLQGIADAGDSPKMFLLMDSDGLPCAPDAQFVATPTTCASLRISMDTDTPCLLQGPPHKHENSCSLPSLLGWKSRQPASP